MGLLDSLKGALESEALPGIVNAVLALLQDDRPAGTTRYAFYTTNYWVKGPKDRQYCFVVPKE